MSRKFALLVGLTELDAKVYGSDGKAGCAGCALDVREMEMLLTRAGFSVERLLTRRATNDRVRKRLESAAKEARAGDLFVFFFSGHGGSLLDNDGDESDGFDETLCLWDGQMRDDVLGEIWPGFAAGVRIVMLSDSCNAGTNYKLMLKGERREVTPPYPTPIKPLSEESSKEMRAAMIHIGGCRDAATSTGYENGGAFTLALSRTLRDPSFKGNYQDLADAISSLVSATQSPQYNEYGPVSEAFRAQFPFSDAESGPGLVRGVSGSGARVDSGAVPASGGVCVTMPEGGGVIHILQQVVIQPAPRSNSGDVSSDRGGHGWP